MCFVLSYQRFSVSARTKNTIHAGLPDANNTNAMIKNVMFIVVSPFLPRKLPAQVMCDDRSKQPNRCYRQRVVSYCICDALVLFRNESGQSHHKQQKQSNSVTELCDHFHPPVFFISVTTNLALVAGNSRCSIFRFNYTPKESLCQT